MMEIANKDVLYKVGNSPSVLDFVIKLTPDELESFKSFISWPPALLLRFKDNPAHLNILHKVWDVAPDISTFFKAYLAMIDNPMSEGVNIPDAFSHGQLSSKMWLVNELSKLGFDLGRVWTLCGWVGTLGYIMLARRDMLRIDVIRSFDVDPRCAVLADTLNRPDVIDGWIFKATTMDVNEMTYDDFSFETKKYDGTSQKLIESADTVINTSCDHMGGNDAWFDRIPPGKLIVLQNNDWFDNRQHDNSVGSISEFMDRYPMTDLIYTGMLDCGIYKRFMMIGRKG